MTMTSRLRLELRFKIDWMRSSNWLKKRSLMLRNGRVRLGRVLRNLSFMERLKILELRLLTSVNLTTRSMRSLLTLLSILKLKRFMRQDTNPLKRAKELIGEVLNKWLLPLSSKMGTGLEYLDKMLREEHSHTDTHICMTKTKIEFMFLFNRLMLAMSESSSLLTLT